MDEEIIDDQWIAIEGARDRCIEYMVTEPYPNVSDGIRYCNRTWDDIMCWPDVPAGVTERKFCPSYINDFNVEEYATRECLSNGTWFVHPQLNKTWTNYTACSKPILRRTSLIEAHMPRIQLLYQVGYGISVIALVIAIVVMVYFRRLRCPRNTIHINLFVSFILRAIVLILRDGLLVHGIGLQGDVFEENGTVSFDDDFSHWECRLLNSLVCYANVANYVWIFVEGLYLHTTIYLAMFSEECSVNWYIALGWVLPVIVTLPWVIVRLTLENKLCWSNHPTPQYLLIIKVPIAATILVNFAFFLNIARVLYVKLHTFDMPSQERQHRNRRLAKSTLILIPMFGVPYFFFLILAAVYERLGDVLQLIHLYMEMTFNSFNGLLVACVLCFFNGEVQTEIGKRWSRWRFTSGGVSGGLAWASDRSVTHVSQEPHNVALLNHRNSFYSSTLLPTRDGTGGDGVRLKSLAAGGRSRSSTVAGSWLDFDGVFKRTALTVDNSRPARAGSMPAPSSSTRSSATPALVTSLPNADCSEKSSPTTTTNDRNHESSNGKEFTSLTCNGVQQTPTSHDARVTAISDGADVHPPTTDALTVQSNETHAG